MRVVNKVKADRVILACMCRTQVWAACMARRSPAVRSGGVVRQKATSFYQARFHCPPLSGPMEFLTLESQG